MNEQDESKYGKLLHSDFDQRESDERNDLWASEFFAFLFMLVINIIMIIVALYTGNPWFLFMLFIFGPLMALFWYGTVKQKKAMNTYILLYERAIVLYDNSLKEEIERYNIADIIRIIIFSDANYIGLVLESNGQRFLNWLDWRRIYNGQHFIDQLKSLNVRVEVDLDRKGLRKLLKETDR